MINDSIIPELSINANKAVVSCNARISEIDQLTLPESVSSEYIKKLNAYIFQDMKELGIDYPAGKFREPSKSDDLNLSYRPLSTGDGFYCMRSFLDKGAVEKFNETLKDLSVENLKKLTTKEFIKSISDLYARLDYTHPFVDGNSRTFRTFTKQVANSAGFLLDWDKTASSDRYRDALYCARGICANNLALSDPLQANFKEYIQNMNEDISFISGGYDINQLLTSLDMVTPNRAVALKEKIEDLSQPMQTNDLINSISDLKKIYPEIEKSADSINNYILTLSKKKSSAEILALTSEILIPSFYKFLKDGYQDGNAHLLNKYIDSTINEKAGHVESKNIEKQNNKSDLER